MYLSGFIYLYHNSKSLIYSVWYTILAYILIQVSETLSYYLLSTVIGENNIESNWFLFSVATLIEIIIFSTALYYLFKIKTNIGATEYINSLPRKVKILIISYCSVFLVVALFQASQARVNENIYWIDNLLLFFLVIMFIGTIYFFNNLVSYQNEITKLETIFEEEIKNNTEMKTFKHDYKNLLLTLQIYLVENKIDEAKKLLEEISSYADNILTENVYQELNLSLIHI
ncbi:hypothetical protein A5802_003008 [Enterococcus mundtii]|uniref:Uncharacterized protein n=3 Tax=Enterococcus mundtii TaxID=53346 RepID=A0A242KUF8_ENTMU|nr:hypothetical protein A5802_003008 [Enterococcus mundtii]